MISQAIAKRYAKGLFAVGERDGKYREYFKEFEEILGVLDREERLKKALILPVVEVEKRKELLNDVLRALQVSPPLASVFTMLLEKNRMTYLPLIKEAYGSLVDEKEGRVKGEVWSAYPLEEEARKRIEKELSFRMGKEVTLAAHEDKNLIGGVKVKIRGTIIDGSVKQQLQVLKENILKE